ncbi:MAG: LemA family protein [Candidatus Omnitrophota bacterium]
MMLMISGVIGIILAVAVLAVVVWLIKVYNSLIQLKVRADGAWADINVQLKRRYDLIPNLVATVEGYATHERSTLEAVTKARMKAMSAGDINQKSSTENALSGTLKTLFAVAENYPQLKANENFLQLQKSLGEIEEALQASRRYYNAVVRDFATQLEVFPNNILAQMFHFTKKEFFQLENPETEQKNPQVKF